VPIIVAVTIMTKNPSQYGLEDLAMDHPADYDTVMVNYPVDLRLVAECVNSSDVVLQDLNPSLLRSSTPHSGSFELHLPAGTKDHYENAIASIPPDKRLWWRFHEVHSGDSIMALARTYHTTAKQIEEANHLDGPELQADAKLVIPVAPGKHPDSDGATYARRITRYKVRRGDTVESVADNFGIAPTMLKRWNGLRGNSLAGRRVLALHLPISPSARDAEAAASRGKPKKAKTETADIKPPATKSAEIERLKTQAAVVHHRVRAGETLYSIANAYRTTVAALKRDNRNIANLHPGMILTIQIVR
jgi:membrane-bound lytic murein transglycosylase D